MGSERFFRMGGKKADGPVVVHDHPLAEVLGLLPSAPRFRARLPLGLSQSPGWHGGPEGGVFRTYVRSGEV